MEETADIERRARLAAARCEVTRLADVTGLDRIGIPVWQAVRPRSRALSVHQGKGLDARSARIGALMEAVESATAEAWSGSGHHCSWNLLPPEKRSPSVDDFSRHRGLLDPGESLAWVEMTPIGPSQAFFVPDTVISLDFTRADDGRFGRCSTGLAAHFSFDAALRHALHEIVERDARGAWQRNGFSGSIGSRIAIESIPFGWFEALTARLTTLGILLRISQIPAVVDFPVFVAELLDGQETDGDYAAASGAGAHEETETALRAAVLEALQSRLTMITGARDDLPIAASPQHRRPLGLGFPTPSFHTEPALTLELAKPVGDARAVSDLVDKLVAAGYPQIGWLRLSAPDSDAIVVKVVVPGLGDLWRERRDVAACIS